MTSSSQTTEIRFDYDVFQHILRLLDDALPAEDVYLVSPFIKLDDRMKEAIRHAISRKVSLTVLIRSDADHPIDDIQWLLKERVLLLQLPKLHAKIYIASHEALVASMNLHETSVKESKEVGVVFRDDDFVDKLKQKVNWWIENSKRVDLVGSSLRSATTDKSPSTSLKTGSVKESSSPSKGHCIRCGEAKSYNPKYPLCDSCFPKYAKIGDREHKEKHCHRCGKAHPASQAYPLCKDCYKADPFDKASRA